MNAVMRVRTGRGIELNVCPCRDCEVNPDSVIPMFYSRQHALDQGWVVTNDRRYCDPKKSTVWVCPSCIQGRTPHEHRSPGR